ncbi:decapping and exoribonuclease protein-like [Branchiostoma lanceolatum]|uniref:decapping and exoribonuclease protein-like n=1 Tax=Branchiostoma lanceolatum TaxID=7740 RepID=UPI00345139DA
MEKLRTDRRGYLGPFPNYSQPEEVGIFSLTQDGFFSDGRNLKYYVEPADRQHVHLDLNHGFPQKLVDWNDEGGDLDHILKWIVEAQRVNPSLLSGVDFVTLRGHLSKVTCTPYKRGWKLAVTKFNGTWYISHVHEQWHENRQGNYWGHKMEQYLTADKARGEPNTDAMVDLNEAFYTVVTSRLNAHSLLFSAEVDARLPDDTLPPPARYVEIKTNKTPCTQNEERNFYRKLQTCWVQSYLVGVPEIVFGFRDNKGVVRSVESFRTRDIPGKVEYGSDWKASVCMNFCDNFLSFVKRCATEDDARVVYLFQPDAQGVTCEVHRGRGSPHTFLPDWYIAAVCR